MLFLCSFDAASRLLIPAKSNILIGDRIRRCLVNDQVLLNLQLLLIHETQLLIIDFDTLIPLRDILKRVRAHVLVVFHHQNFLLIVGVAALGQQCFLATLSMTVVLLN